MRCFLGYNVKGALVDMLKGKRLTLKPGYLLIIWPAPTSQSPLIEERAGAHLRFTVLSSNAAALPPSSVTTVIFQPVFRKPAAMPLIVAASA